MTWNDIPGWFTFAPIYQQAVADASDGDTFVEVGCFLGKSTAFLASAIKASGKKIDFWAIDTWKGSEGTDSKSDRTLIPLIDREGGDLFPSFWRNMEQCGVADAVKPLQTSSIGGKQRFENGTLAFVFIDAAHDYLSVQSDVGAWWEKLKPGGVLAGHDADWPGVRAAVWEKFGPSVTLHGNGYLTWKVVKPMRNDHVTVDDWLTIGNLYSCGRIQADIAVHVYRSDFPDVCSFAKAKTDLTFDYRDGDPFTPAMLHALDELAARLRESGKAPTLIHCHAGITRSPMLAAYLLARVDGIGLWSSMAKIGVAFWEQRREAPNFTYDCVKQLQAELGERAAK